MAHATSLIFSCALAALAAHAAQVNGDGTYYLQNNAIGACGVRNEDNSYIAAVSHAVYNQNMTSGNPNEAPVCKKCIQVVWQSKAVNLRIADKCDGCKNQDVDMSTLAFNSITGGPTLGRVNVQWIMLPNCDKLGPVPPGTGVVAELPAPPPQAVAPIVSPVPASQPKQSIAPQQPANPQALPSTNTQMPATSVNQEIPAQLPQANQPTVAQPPPSTLIDQKKWNNGTVQIGVRFNGTEIARNLNKLSAIFSASPRSMSAAHGLFVVASAAIFAF